MIEMISRLLPNTLTNSSCLERPSTGSPCAAETRASQKTRSIRNGHISEAACTYRKARWKVTSKWKAPNLQKTCEHGVLAWDWETSNSCIPSTFTQRGNQPRMTPTKFARIFNLYSWPFDMCSPTRPGESFSNCADVRVVASNDPQPAPTTAPTTAPIPAPTPTPIPAPTPTPNRYYAPTWRYTNGAYACECAFDTSPTQYISEASCVDAFRRGMFFGITCASGPTPSPTPTTTATVTSTTTSTATTIAITTTSTSTTTALSTTPVPTAIPSPTPLPSPSPRPHKRQWYSKAWKWGNGGFLCKCKTVRWKTKFTTEMECLTDFQKAHDCKMQVETPVGIKFIQKPKLSSHFINMTNTMVVDTANVEAAAILQEPILFPRWKSEIDCLTAFRRGDMGIKCTDESAPASSPTRPPVPSPRPPRSSMPTLSMSGPKVFLGYYGNTDSLRATPYTFTPENIPADKLTHVSYAYAYIGSPMYAAGIYAVRPAKDDDDDECHLWHKGTYCKLKELKEQYPHLKTLISIGGRAFSTPEEEDPANAAEMRRRDPGWSHLIFSDLVISAQNRKLFITSAINFCREWSFDGIDIAWHFPNQRADDKYNFALLLEELRRAIDADAIATNQPPLILTLAVSANPGVASAAYDVAGIRERVDWIHVMTYDMYSHRDIDSGAQMHAQLWGTNSETIVGGADSINWWVGEGMPRNKLTYGVVTYARTYKLRSARPKQKPDASVVGPGRAFGGTRTPGMAAYFEVIKVLRDAKAVATFDSLHCGAYVQKGTLWMGYDDEKTMQCKAEYVEDQHLLGGFVWEVGMDDLTSGSPLVSAFSEAIRLPEPMPMLAPPVEQYEPTWRELGEGFACECIAVAWKTESDELSPDAIV
eukprot:GEMP01003785.1.p1 GENE.GEMP01003785.1~~GEMP01003785.1.p1  ORF type:complete len:874 (+),score=151.98 GEMP01003785.1:526-3147(+)